MEHKIRISGKEFPVIVTYKKMKYARLKVFYTGEIKLSVPHDTPEEWITEFIESKISWLEEQISLFPAKTDNTITDGSKLQFLGNELTVYIHEAKRKQIVLDGAALHIYTPDFENIEQQLDNWWQKTAREYYQSVLDRLYPVVRRYGVAKPTFSVKKMRTRWGSCSRRTWNISLNYHLMKANERCIEYVVLHELTHFIYPDHDRNFYNFLTFYMPDWQKREKELDYRFVY